MSCHKCLTVRSVFVPILGMLAWLVTHPTNAQTDKVTLMDLSLRNWANPYRPSTANQEGTPFLFDEWDLGTINMVKGKQYTDLRLKYNLLHGRLLLLNEGEASPRMMIPMHIKSFSIRHADSTYTFQRHLVPLSDSKTPMDQFFIELVSGHYFLLARPGKQAQKEERNVLAQIDEQNNVKYVDIVEYFIETPDGKIHLFRNSKKVKAAIFGDQLPAIEKFAKQNKLKWARQADLIQIVSQMNQL